MIDFLTSSSFAFIVAFVIVTLLLGAGTDWVRRRQVRDRHRALATTPGKIATADDEHIAARVLDVLAEHVRLDAEGISRTDRLEDDLDLDIAANPDVFYALERALGIDCRLDNFETFEATTAGLETVNDVISYVAEMTGKARSKPAPATRRIDGIEVIAICWFAGIIAMVVGDLRQSPKIMAIGLIVAFAPLSFGLVRVLLHVIQDLMDDVRQIGAREVLKNPLAVLAWLFMAGLMLFAVVVFCGLLRAAFSTV